MIDFNQPIRRKSDRRPVSVFPLTSYYVEPPDDPKVYKLTLSEVEAIYENYSPEDSQ